MSVVFLGIAWQPWHLAAGAGVVCLALYLLARVQLERAKEDWANAFFYSPSTKAKQRQRRQRWRDWCWILLGCTVLSFLAATVLYVIGRLPPAG